MRDFPSCFGETGVQVADSSSSTSMKAAQNLVTCVYRCQIHGNPCFISVTWTKNLMGQILTLEITDPSNQSLCRTEIKPWMFSKRKGFKIIDLNSGIIHIYWDLSSAKFGSGPEPLESFYLSVVSNREIVLLIGDLEEEARRKIEAVSADSDPIFVAKKLHLFGKKLYGAKTQFKNRGKTHEIKIECEIGGDSDPNFVIRIDGKAVMEVKRLIWKFRGNQTILVEGFPVEVYWDVHGWLFGNLMGSAVFLFQTSVLDEKLHSLSSSSGFSLILCAWKNE